MKFVKHDLGQRDGGEAVEVVLEGNPANVRLMDSANLRLYRYGQKFNCISGSSKDSPVLLEIPRAGHWYVVVDLAGRSGKVTSNIRILEGEAVSGLKNDSAVAK